MNILPFVLLLILSLSLITVRNVENFKNEKIIQKEYREFVKKQEYHNSRFGQLRLFRENSDNSSPARQLNFRPFYSQRAFVNLQNPGYEKLKFIFKELVKVLYEEADFYKKMVEKRPNFMEDIIKELEQQREDKGLTQSVFKGSIENLATVNLTDSELQDIFYQMLKGTIEKNKNPLDYWAIDPDYKKKSYKSLLDFLRDQADRNNGSSEQISFFHAPKELLQAIYNEDIALKIIEKRNEIKKEIKKDSDREVAARQFFQQLSAFIKPQVGSEIFHFRTKKQDPKELDGNPGTPTIPKKQLTPPQDEQTQEEEDDSEES